jgi:glycosyltransferase involved in cell wall biosynthesis
MNDSANLVQINLDRDAFPLVSVGLAVYNGENFVEAAIRSILAQSWQNWELIISDNASTDSTEQICLTYAARDKRIRYYRNDTNLGAAWNQNRVAQLAIGKYFKLAAHDDVCAPRFLEECIRVMEKDSSIVLSYSQTKIIDRDGTIIESNDDASLTFKRSKLSQILRLLIKPIFGDGKLHFDSDSPRVRFQSVVCNIDQMYPIFGVIRRNVMGEMPLFGNYGHADNVTLARLALLGKFYQVPEVLFFSRQHSEQSSVKFQKQGRQDYNAYSQWWDPNNPRKLAVPRWIVFQEYLNTIDRSNIDLQNRLGCYIDILRWLRGNWLSLLAEIFSVISSLFLGKMDKMTDEYSTI